LNQALTDEALSRANFFPLLTERLVLSGDSHPFEVQHDLIRVVDFVNSGNYIVKIIFFNLKESLIDFHQRC
jgi:hypothetical protein